MALPKSLESKTKIQHRAALESPLRISPDNRRPTTDNHLLLLLVLFLLLTACGESPLPSPAPASRLTPVNGLYLPTTQGLDEAVFDPLTENEIVDKLTKGNGAFHTGQFYRSSHDWDDTAKTTEAVLLAAGYIPDTLDQFFSNEQTFALGYTAAGKREVILVVVSAAVLESIFSPSTAQELTRQLKPDGSLVALIFHKS